MIYLIITTCILNKHGIQDYEGRKTLYIKCIQQALKFARRLDIKTIIVENNGKRETYLDTLECDVVYTENNLVDTHNKALNELRDIQEVMRLYNIDDNDMVIKLTGRYLLLNDMFFNMVWNTEADICVKYYNMWTDTTSSIECILGLYAIRAKYLKIFKLTGNYSGEVEFALFIQQYISQNKIQKMSSLFLNCLLAENYKTVVV
jgi:hypothetical protein